MPPIFTVTPVKPGGILYVNVLSFGAASTVTLTVTCSGVTIGALEIDSPANFGFNTPVGCATGDVWTVRAADVASAAYSEQSGAVL